MVPAFSTRAYTISGVPTSILQQIQKAAQQLQLNGISFNWAKWFSLRPENIRNTEENIALTKRTFTVMEILFTTD